MMDHVQENKAAMIASKKWVVVGATPKEDKFGYKIYKMLKQKQYQVWGINPNYTELEGEVMYDSLKGLPEKPECISVVVPPSVAMKLVEEAAEAGVSYIWFQPGTYDQEVLQRARDLKLRMVYNDCVLVALGH